MSENQSAETLRKAARLMRERAEAATPGPWEYDPEDMDPSVWSDSGAAGTWVVAEWGVREANAEHIASWHPAVALAVADWLESEAREFDQLLAQSLAVNLLIETADNADAIEARINIGYQTVTQALAVARAYLGRDS